ncbi:MAG TPA: biosynthetic-type acetolactate synthase large subunit [Clostridiaceae bacterium]|nr:biosynthetic-type acetolactate synthase large subunit [Clostridiaceae bacterium]
MKASDAIVKCLLNEGVDIVFGYPGAAVIDLYESLRKSKIRHVLVRQEQAAAHSASGYARVSGKAGVCIATSGPGATNLITGIATAYMDSIPLVVITGQVKSAMIGRDVFQEADITGATESFTKHSYLVKDADDLPRIIKEAFYIATTGRPGPVLIDIPSDIQAEKLEKFIYPDTVDIRGYKPTLKGHPGQIKRAVKAISESKRPLIVAGGGVLLSDAQSELTGFINKSRIPVVHTLMGKGAVPTQNPYYVGMIGTHGFAQANIAMLKSDLLIFIGARIADRAWGGIGDKMKKDAQIIHIDIDPAEIGKNLGPNIPLVGDVKHILTEMTSKTEPLDTDDWLEELRSHRKTAQHAESDFVNPKYAVELLSKKLDDDAILVADVGQNQMWAARHFEDKEGRRFLTSGGLGTMGYSLPAAVGAKFAAPGRQVAAVVGDGGFQMSQFELGTISANNLKLVILLFNNSRLGMVRELQDRKFGRITAVELDKNPDFIKLCDAYGIKGVRVTADSELEAAFDKALKSKGPFLVECVVDCNECTL